jgi:hypothetical protein
VKENRRTPCTFGFVSVIVSGYTGLSAGHVYEAKVNERKWLVDRVLIPLGLTDSLTDWLRDSQYI